MKGLRVPGLRAVDHEARVLGALLDDTTDEEQLVDLDSYRVGALHALLWAMGGSSESPAARARRVEEG